MDDSISKEKRFAIEQRLNQIEAAIRELQQQKAASETNWLKEITGSFADDPIFDEVMAYGREIRQADRPSSLRLNSRSHREFEG
jgi:hypothetical protein